MTDPLLEPRESNRWGWDQRTLYMADFDSGFELEPLDFPAIHKARGDSPVPRPTHDRSYRRWTYQKLERLLKDDASIAYSKRGSTELRQYGNQDDGFSISRDSEILHEVERKWWNSFWLTKKVLASFFLVFLILLFLILGLFRHSQASNGLVTASEDAHYVWTYVPTTVFVLLASLWHQVDFYCKTLTPYNEMRKRPTQAKHSLFLDYVQPMYPVNIWRAWKYRHWAVLISIAVDLFLKLSVVLASSLLVLQPMPISTQSHNLVSLSQFNASGYNATEVGADAIESFYASRVKGQPWAYGSTENLAFETFGFNKSAIPGSVNGTGALVQAEVLGINAPMQCEIAKIVPQIELQDRPWLMDATLSSFLVGDISGQDCELKNVSLGETNEHDVFMNVNETTGWQSSWEGYFGVYVCNTGFNYVNEDNPLVAQPKAISPDQYRFLFTMSQIEYYYHWNATEYGKDPEDDIDADQWRIAQTTGVICKPSLTVDRYSVTLAPRLSSLVDINLVPNTTTSIPGYDLVDMINGVAMNAETAQFGRGSIESRFTSVIAMFQLLAKMNGDSDQISLLRPATLLGLAGPALEGIAAQLAQTRLRQSIERPLSGVITVTKQQLVIRSLSIALLLPSLGLLCVLVLLLMWTRPINAVPCDPTSIFSAAAMLTASTRLKSELASAGVEADSADQKLSKFSYQTHVDANGGFVIEPRFLQPVSSNRRKKSSAFKSTTRWWRPSAMRLWFLPMLIFYPLMLLIILLSLQMVSDKNQGLINIVPGDYYDLAFSYLPVVLMILVAISQQSREIAVHALLPFISLRSGLSSPDIVVSESPLSTPLIQTLFSSFRRRWWSSSFAISATFLSSFLTILISGLYSVEPVTISRDLQVAAADSFNLTHIDLSLSDQFAGMTTKLILRNGLPQPPLTYRNLVFPSLRADFPGSDMCGSTLCQNVLMNVRIPALRPILPSCFVGGSEQMNATVGEETRVWTNATGVVTSLSAWFDVPVLEPKPSRATWIEPMFLPFTADNDVSHQSYGLVVSLTLEGTHSDGFEFSDQTFLEGGVEEYGSFDVNPATPNVGIMAGFATGHQVYEDAKSGWNLQFDPVNAVCYQGLEEVMVNLTLNWPDLTTDLTNPPITDETTARTILANETMTSSWFMLDSLRGTGYSPYWFGISMNFFLDALVNSRYLSPVFSPWFEAMQFVTGLPTSSFLGEANEDTLLKSSSLLYGIYAAQAISINMRAHGAQPGQTLRTYNATVMVSAFRLKQNEGPTIALVILLSAITICSALSCFLIRTEAVLAQAPCSIAGTMSLLARSQLCGTRDVIPEGAEWWTNKERKKRSLFDGWHFRLRWWSNDDNEQWYGIDIVNDVSSTRNSRAPFAEPRT